MLNKKIKNSNAAAKITSATLESNNLITYFTEDAHNLFVGGIVSVSGVTGGPTGATQPNPVVSNVYRVDNPTSFTVYVNTAYTATSFPVTFTSSGTVQAAQGSLGAVTLSYAQPVKAVRPTFFNYISPTITATASGNRVLLSWDASGVAYPTPSVTVGRYDSTGATLLGSVSTAASGSSVIDPSGTDLTADTEYIYKVTASNTASIISASTSVTSLFIDAPASISASATASTANSINVTWAPAVTNAALTSYTIQRSTNGGAFATTYATTSGTVTSFTDTGLTETSNYRYKVLANADYTSAGTGIVVSGVSATSATITPYFISTVTPTATVTASTANSITVTWSAPVTSNPAVSGYSLQRSTDGGLNWSADLTLTSPTATTYVDTAALSGITYTYRLAAINAQLTSAYTSSGTATAYYLSDPVSAPVASNSSTSTTSITVTGSYTANPAISGYNIQRAVAGTSPTFASIGATNYSITLPYVDTTVSANTSYLYQIKAKNAQLTTANWSTSSNSILSYSVPFNPTSVNASSINATAVTVTWSGASVNSTNTPITSYTLGYKLSSTTTYTTLTGISGSSYTVTGLTTDSAYDFRVLAVNGIGTATTTGALVATATPVRVADTSVSLADYNGSTPYFNTLQYLTAVATVGRSVTVQISSDNSNWSDLTTYTSGGTDYPSWTADTTAIRYFRLVVAQDSTYTQTISNTVTIDPINNYLSVSLYSDTYNDGSTQTTVASSGTVVVTVSDVYGTPVVGATVSWKGVQFPASSYTTRVTNTTDSNGRATLTLSSASPALDLTTSFEFQIDATKTNYNSALSNNLETYYIIYVRETDTAHANIARSYAGSNAVRTGQGTDLYYGYFDTTWDTQKSAMGFTTFPSWAKLDASAEVISATLRLTRGSSSGSSPGTLYIGTHENASGSSSSWDTYGEAAFGNISTRLQSHSISYSETDTITLNSTILAKLYAGSVRGFTIGPPTSTNVLYYGRVEGVGAGSSIDPVFTVTYTVSPSFNVP